MISAKAVLKQAGLSLCCFLGIFFFAYALHTYLSVAAHINVIILLNALGALHFKEWAVCLQPKHVLNRLLT